MFTNQLYNGVLRFHGDSCLHAVRTNPEKGSLVAWKLQGSFRNGVYTDENWVHWQEGIGGLETGNDGYGPVQFHRNWVPATTSRTDAAQPGE